MYRLLEVGEVIESGDEYFDVREWKPFRHLVGLPIMGSTLPSRRLVTPAASSVPDPGEGWRLLKPDELVQQGDQYYSKSIGWIESDNWRTNGKQGTNPAFVLGYRRRVPPVVSVGDRVKVLTGPWAGCTGYVRYARKYLAMPDDLSVMLDNVFVGGEKLTVVVLTASVEKLPPVVPEVLYRDLSHGETVKAGDQFWQYGYGPWVDAGPEEIGNTIGGFKARHRRPVRLQSLGWRYLDAGETVQAGDETRYTHAPHWRNCCGRAGWCIPEGHETYFRRKLPTISGG